jgi:hypothetical protein
MGLAEVERLVVVLVRGALTVSLTVLDVLVLKLLSPKYTAERA